MGLFCLQIVSGLVSLLHNLFVILYDHALASACKLSGLALFFLNHLLILCSAFSWLVVRFFTAMPASTHL
jgi:hypothetical protein